VQALTNKTKVTKVNEGESPNWKPLAQQT